MEHIVLVGAMGAGKTTIGRVLARRLRRPFLDSDSELERVHGETGGEIAARDGIDRLHAVEVEIFDGLSASHTPAVIAPAASVVDSIEGRELLAGNVTVWLDAPEDVLADRRRRGDHRRPIDLQEVRELERRRRPMWEKLSEVRVDTSGSVDESVEAVLEGIRSPDRGQKPS